METANKDNVAETPFPQNSNPRTGPKTIESVARELVAAIIAKVQADIESPGHSVNELLAEALDHPDFQDKVNELAYIQADGAIADADISYQVEEVVDNMDLSCQVENVIDCMDILGPDDVEGVLVDLGVERRISALEGGGTDKDLLARIEELEQFTASKFQQLDNIQIAFRGLVETMFTR